MLKKDSKTSSTTAVSDYEEQIWLLQQQHPDRVGRHLNVWKLDRDADLALLTQAIQDVIEEMTDLNTRYRFSDEGDLQKLKIAGSADCLASRKLQSDEVIAKLLALQAASWDAAKQPPFNALLIRTENDAVLAFVHHPILDETYKQEDLLAGIRNRYDSLARSNHPLALTEVQVLAPGSNTHAPRTKGEVGLSEEQVASIILKEFRFILADPGMTLNDDFFDRGGHSLVATRLIGKLASTYGIEVGFNDFFKSPTAAALAASATVNGRDNPQQGASQISEDAEQAPLTLAQTFLWRAYAANGFSTIFNLPFALEFRDSVDEGQFFQAFNDILERHPGLRTIFHEQNGEAYQRIVPVSELGQYKWFWTSAESAGVTLASEASYAFNLARELAIRIRFIRDPMNGHQILSFLVHHMVIDEWSLNTMMAELAQAYLARSAGNAPIWKTQARSIVDFALRQKKQGVDPKHVDYWTRMLRGAPRGLRLSDSSDRPAAPAREESFKAQWLELTPEPGMFESLSAAARDHESSLFGVVYTAIALSLSKLGNLAELVIGTSASGRTDPEFFDTAGYFTTMVAHRLQFDAQQSVAAILRNVTRTINDSMPYADVPIDLIQNALGMTPADGLLFDVYIQIHANNALNGALRTPDGGSIRYRQITPDKNESMFGLHIEIMEDVFDGQRSLRLVVTYRPDRYSTAQVRDICAEITKMFALFDTTCATERKLGEIFL